jgi:hypothetical protein
MSRRENAKNWPDIRPFLERMVGDMVTGLPSSGPLIQESELDLENLIIHIRTDRQPTQAERKFISSEVKEGLSALFPAFPRLSP